MRNKNKTTFSKDFLLDELEEEGFDRAVKILDSKSSSSDRAKKELKAGKEDKENLANQVDVLEDKIDNLFQYTEESFNNIDKEAILLKNFLSQISENLSNLDGKADKLLPNMESVSCKRKFLDIKVNLWCLLAIFVLSIIISCISSCYIIKTFPQYVSLSNPDKVVVQGSKVSIWNSKKLDLKK